MTQRHANGSYAAVFIQEYAFWGFRWKKILISDKNSILITIRRIENSNWKKNIEFFISIRSKKDSMKIEVKESNCDVASGDAP